MGRGRAARRGLAVHFERGRDPARAVRYRQQAAARELGEELDRLAQRTADPTHRLEAQEVLARTCFILGDYAAARTSCEQGIALTELTAQRALALLHDVAPGVGCLHTAAHTLWCLGYPAQAVRRMQEALALAHPYSVAFAQQSAVGLHHRRREVPAVQAQADALLTLATAQWFPLHVGTGTCWRGWALAMQGQGEAAQAAACFQQALAIARRQQAKSWELRAAMSLSRLWQQQGKRTKARELLAPVYGWFTEGFDTADLQEAKALLEALGT